ncbi:MAG: hypothetical protein WBA41_19070 [Rivularia sp. (in: cyanobacteria)]
MTYSHISASRMGRGGRWGDGEMGRWGRGGRGGDGEMGRWGDGVEGEMGRWGDGVEGECGESLSERDARTNYGGEKFLTHNS